MAPPPPAHDDGCAQQPECIRDKRGSGNNPPNTSNGFICRNGIQNAHNLSKTHHASVHGGPLCESHLAAPDAHKHRLQRCRQRELRTTLKMWHHAPSNPPRINHNGNCNSLLRGEICGQACLHRRETHSSDLRSNQKKASNPLLLSRSQGNGIEFNSPHANHLCQTSRETSGV